MTTKIVQLEVEVPDDMTSEKLVEILANQLTDSFLQDTFQMKPITEIKVVRTIKENPSHERPTEKVP
jgi:hypothetical protein